VGSNPAFRFVIDRVGVGWIRFRWIAWFPRRPTECTLLEPLPLGRAGMLACLAAATATLVARAWLWVGLHPALYSPEELLTARIAVELLQNGKLEQALWAYQYPASAGGSLLFGLLHVPFAVPFGPSELSLKAVSMCWAALSTGLWTAAAWRSGGARAGAWMGAVATAAPLYLAFRQVTALGNHVELLPLMAVVVLLLQERRHWAGLGAVVMFGVWFDLLFVVALPSLALALWRVRPKLWPLGLGALVGAGPLVLRALIPEADPPTRVHSNDIWNLLHLDQLWVGLRQQGIDIPMLGPNRPWPGGWTARPLSWVTLPTLVYVLARGWRGNRPDLLFAAGMVLFFAPVHAISMVKGPHVQTPFVLPLIYCIAALLGLGRRTGRWGAGMLFVLLVQGVWDHAGARCPQNRAVAGQTAGLEWARSLNLQVYTASQVAGISAYIEHGAPQALQPEGFASFFQLSTGGPGANPFTWRFFDMIDRNGWLERDVCVSELSDVPAPEVLARLFPSGSSTSYLKAAGWGLAVRTEGDPEALDRVRKAARPHVRWWLVWGLGAASGCGSTPVEPPDGFEVAFEAGRKGCHEPF